MSTIRNLTNHIIKVRVPGNEKIIYPDGVVARLGRNTYLDAGWVDLEGQKVPIRIIIPGQVQDLPEPEEGVILLVSSIIRTHSECINRKDLLSPDTSYFGVIKDKQDIIGTTGFVKNQH